MYIVFTYTGYDLVGCRGVYFVYFVPIYGGGTAEYERILIDSEYIYEVHRRNQHLYASAGPFVLSFIKIPG